MTALGGPRRGRRILALSLIGAVMAVAVAFGHGPAAVRAAEATSSATTDKAKPTPPKVASTKKKAGTAKTKSKSKSAAKKKSTAVAAKPKLPLPPPPKPTALARQPTPPEASKTDIATSLDKGTAEVFSTNSRNAKPLEKPVDAAPQPEDVAKPAVKPPAAAPEAEAVAPPPEPKVAAAPPAPAVTLTKESLRIQFSPGAAELPDSAAPSIGELAALMAREQTLRLQLLAFAAGTKETASQSRRLSLNRALAVRGALIDAGVRSTRIDVRALGNQTEESPADRVDVLVMQRGGG